MVLQTSFCFLVLLSNSLTHTFFVSAANAALVSGANKRKAIIKPISASFFIFSPQISGSGAGGGAFLPPNPVVIAAGAADTVGIFILLVIPLADGVSRTGAGAGDGV